MSDFITREIHLPSGKIVTVAVPASLKTPKQDTMKVDLTLCPHCMKHFVYPQSWNELDEYLWRVLLHCPNCDWLGDGVWDYDTIVDFDDKLNKSVDDMIEIADVLAKEASWTDL
jgi:hypothetical protein